MSHPFSPLPRGTGSPAAGVLETLRAQLATLEPILDRLADGLVILEEFGQVVFANLAARRLLANGAPLVPATDWIVRYGFLCPAKDFPPLRALRGEIVSESELCLQRPARLSMSAFPLRDGGGICRGSAVIFREIGRQSVSQNVRGERDWSDALMDTVASLVVVLERTGGIVAFNRACELATGYCQQELQGKPVWDLLMPEELESVRPVFEDLSAGHFPNRHENHWRTKDGSARLISWSNTALLDAKGAVEYIIASGIDVTEQRRAEAELRQANEKLSAVIRTSPLAIVHMDLKGRVLNWNPAAERMFGWQEQEVIGKLFPIVPEEDLPFFWGNLDRARKGETLAGVERQRRRRDGTLIDVTLWNAVQRDAGGETTSVISVIADMTERKRLEDQFRQSQKMEAVGRLAGGVAHDFNNLLTIITGYGQMMFEGLEPEHPLRDYVQEVLHAAESAAALTNQLLAFSRRQVVQPQLLDLNVLVVGMDKMLHRLIGEDIELATSLSPRLPKVKVDPGQFQQVILNLVVNARDAMPEGGRLVVETAAAQLDPNDTPLLAGLPPGPCVVLMVSDNGKGMSDDTRRHLFEPFFTTKGKGKGTGLGLSTVYGIVKQAGGEILVETEAGRGTTFRIYLPGVEDVQAAAVETGATPQRRRGTETVLVVEDESGLGKLIREVLETHGYAVLPASEFREALRLCEQHLGPIHLMLTDMVMPHMSGRDLAQRATGLRPHLRVLYMSGYTDHVALHETDPVPAFLQKPFTPEMLLNKVREVLDAPRH